MANTQKYTPEELKKRKTNRQFGLVVKDSRLDEFDEMETVRKEANYPRSDLFLDMFRKLGLSSIQKLTRFKKENR
jgi:hypothetical protein